MTQQDRDVKAGEQFLGIVEEVGELAHHLLKQAQGIRGEDDWHTAQQRDAVADILIFLTGFCYRRRWDLEQILLETWKEVRSRDWKRFPKNGKTE
jgi:NTP pyrophosphatase (non-canonical NTP hydrolase)